MNAILDPRWAVFLTVADRRSMSGAALSLDLPQSVVSRQIAQLEAEAGARLFQRTGRGVVLTELGRQVYPRIRALRHEADQLADDIRNSGATPIGDVRLGLLPFSVALVAGPLFAAVRKAWPGVRLHLTEGSSAQLEEWLSQGRLDLALLLREEDEGQPPAPDPAAANETVLKRLPLHLIVPARHPLARRKTIDFDEVARLPLVLPGEPHRLRARLARLAEQRRLSLIQAMEADSIQLQHEIVACEGGFAITAPTFMLRHRHRLAGVLIVRPKLHRAIVLAVTPHRAHTRATREASRLLKEIAPGLLA